MTVATGEIRTGKVTGITKFGAFVEIEPGVTGLVHISEVSNSFVKEVSDFLAVGDEVKVKVINIGENGKIALSVKQALPPPEPVEQPTGFGFEDKLARFMKDSNERLTDLKRHQEGRKGRSK